MKKLIVLLLVVLGLNLLWSEKMFLQKGGVPKQSELRLKHPAEEIFNSRQLPEDNRKIGADENKLIVILVQFQEELEDDPSTTGNGHFQTEVDDSFPITIGAPPHDQEYYSYMLESVRYYYQAASYGHFDLDYDIWPKDKSAYTLSKKMSYYSPGNVGSYEFVERLEEFFKESWETADREDPEIDFSQYHHFMIVHAGADWQHDIAGDTPSDMPSLFIKIGTGKEAVVDNGDVLINKSCNVPETLTQDIREYALVDEFGNETGDILVNGYGATNAVYAHEFGHSMGLVDLYNTMSSSPMVGFFDIMDNGGSGVMQDYGTDGKLYNIEGGLPALPGAYSKEIMFEDIFRSEGIMKDISELDFEETFSFSAAETRVKPSDKLRIIKVPLSDTQYILLENRSVDPDGDGDTAVKSALGRRIILYPTARGDDLDTPTYEYDFLLPSWQKYDPSAGFYRSYGGGVLAWRINEDVLNKVLFIDDEGNPVTNFDNNSVNTNTYRQGVEIIEADNIEDIGEPSSYYWAGTAYEYFFPQKPILDTDGMFVSWSNEEHTPRFSGATKPALADWYGFASPYTLDFLSNPSGVMDMKISFLNSEYSEKIYHNDDLVAIGPTFKSEFGTEIPIVTTEGLRFKTKIEGSEDWQDLYDVIVPGLNQLDYEPVVYTDSDGETNSLILVSNNDVTAVTLPNDHVFDELPQITASPIVFNNMQGESLRRLLGIPTVEGFYVFQGNNGVFHQVDFVEGNVAEVGYYSNNDINNTQKLLITFVNRVLEYDMQNEGIDGYSPVSFYNTSYNFNGYSSVAGTFISENGVVLGLDSERMVPTQILEYSFKEIINVSSYDNTPPTNLAFGKFGYLDNVYVWGAGKYLFAMKNGALLEGFPVQYDDIRFKPKGYPRLIGGAVQMPTDNNGYYTIGNRGDVSYADSYTIYSQVEGNYLYYESEYLKNLIVDNDNTVILKHILEFDDNPISFSGHRSLFTVKDDNSNTQVTGFDVYIYPNPVRSYDPRLRVYNPNGDFKLKIYDVAGNKIMDEEVSINTTDSENQYYEYPINVDKMSAGAYFCIYKDGDNTKTIKFAIEK